MIARFCSSVLWLMKSHEEQNQWLRVTSFHNVVSVWRHIKNYNQIQSREYGFMNMYLTSNSLPYNSHLFVVILLFPDRQLHSLYLLLKRRDIVVNVRRCSLTLSSIFRKRTMKQWIIQDLHLRFDACRLYNNLIRTVALQDHAFNCS